MTRRGWLAVIGAWALAKLLPGSMLTSTPPPIRLGLRARPGAFTGPLMVDIPPSYDPTVVARRVHHALHDGVRLYPINYLDGGQP